MQNFSNPPEQDTGWFFTQSIYHPFLLLLLYVQGEGADSGMLRAQGCRKRSAARGRRISLWIERCKCRQRKRTLGAMHAVNLGVALKKCTKFISENHGNRVSSKEDNEPAQEVIRGVAFGTARMWDGPWLLPRLEQLWSPEAQALPFSSLFTAITLPKMSKGKAHTQIQNKRMGTTYRACTPRT